MTPEEIKILKKAVQRSSYRDKAEYVKFLVRLNSLLRKYEMAFAAGRFYRISA